MRTLKQIMDMTDRVAIITGGGGHIGRAAAEALSELGAVVAIVDINEAAANATVAAIVGQGGRAQAFPLDLGCDAAIKALPGQIEAQFGRLDVLINNASFVGTSALTGFAVPFAEQSVDTWRKVVDVNMTAVFALTQACAPLLAASGHGSVINVASIYGVLGPDMSLYEGTAMGNPAAYAASKGGVVQLTRWLATVLGPAVRVNALSPGGVARGQPAVFRDRYEARTPLKRMAVEEDMKGTMAWLASDLSAYVTGQNIMVDGGWSAW